MTAPVLPQSPVKESTTLLNHQQLALYEHEEMKARIAKLHEFFAGEVFPTLSNFEQECYKNQCLHLRLANDHLAQRISSFQKA